MLGKENIGQFPECGCPPLRRPQRSRVAAVGHRAEGLAGKGARFVGGERAYPSEGHASRRCPPARTSTVFDDVGLGARRLHAHPEPDQGVIPDEMVRADWLEAVHQPFGDPTIAHAAPHLRAQGTTEEPRNWNRRRFLEITIYRKCR